MFGGLAGITGVACGARLQPVVLACSLWWKFRGLAKMVTGTKFRDDRSRGLLYLRARKFEPVTTFAEPA
jgi:hypothetical protein